MAFAAPLWVSKIFTVRPASERKRRTNFRYFRP